MSPQAKLIERLVTVFGMPERPDPDAFLNEFAKALKGWPEQVLEKAGDRIIRSSTFWPKPSEVALECERVIAWERKPEPNLPLGDEPSQPTPEAKQRVRAMVADLKAKIAMQSLPERDVVLPPTDAFEFERMQATSPNRGLHRGTP